MRPEGSYCDERRRKESEAVEEGQNQWHGWPVRSYDFAWRDCAQPHLAAADGHVFRVGPGWPAHAIPLPALCVACHGRFRHDYRGSYCSGAGGPYFAVRLGIVGRRADGCMALDRCRYEGRRRTMAVQLNHAGRKASTGCFSIGFGHESVPEEQGGWKTVGPSANAFGSLTKPRALTVDEIHAIVDQFRDAAWRAYDIGFDAVEIHAAHGYLLSQFLDPLINEREDEYGGSFENRIRMLVEVVDAVRSVVPDTMPVLVRVSATDWAAGGWDLDQTVDLAKVLKEHGVDLVDVSTGGMIPGVTIPVKPGYQVPFSEQVRSRAGIPTTAVGLITKRSRPRRSSNPAPPMPSKSDVRHCVIRTGRCVLQPSLIFRPKMRPISHNTCGARIKWSR